jgi:hypothetical protein
VVTDKWAMKLTILSGDLKKKVKVIPIDNLIYSMLIIKDNIYCGIANTIQIYSQKTYHRVAKEYVASGTCFLY